MAKHGLGKGLSALFSMYDDPILANSEVEKEKMRNIAKKVEEEKKERQQSKIELTTSNEANVNINNSTNSNKVDDVLEKAKTLLDDIKTTEPKILKNNDNIEPIQNPDFLEKKKSLESKLNKIEQEISKRELPQGVVQLQISQIEVNLEQPRKNFDKEALLELSESIKQHGVVQPIIVVERNGKYMIVAGERRYRATKMAGIKVIPAIVKNYTNREIKEIALIENLQREDLNPVEVAYAIKQLIDEFNFTQEEVAAKLGVSRPLITNILRILKLEPEVIAMVEKKKLSPAHAKILGGVSNKEDQIKFARKACDDKISVRDFERIIQEYLQPTEKKKEKIGLSDELKDFVNRMQKTFKTKVGMFGTNKKGRIYIDYYTSDDLDRISSLMEKLGY